jgi:hypothetical protein
MKLFLLCCGSLLLPVSMCFDPIEEAKIIMYELIINELSEA